MILAPARHIFEHDLGLIDALACPHWDGEPERQSVFRDSIAASGSIGYAVDDGAALHFHGEDFVEAVTSRPHASACLVTPSGTIPLPVRYLGSEAASSSPATQL